MPIFKRLIGLATVSTAALILTQVPMASSNEQEPWRARPGMSPDEARAVQAAAAVGHAQVEGSRQGSLELTFTPRGIHPGDYHFDIGTAGSTGLVLQTVFLPLSFAGGSSAISISGGTHVPWSPCYHYLDLQWRPMLEKIGYRLRLSLQHAGFYPRGGGLISANIEPAGKLSPLNLIN